jgi:glucokinase
MKILAGDIGGTKAHLALFEVRQAALHEQHERRFRTSDFPSLAAIVEAFRKEAAASIDSACFAIAGPLVGEEFRGPNLGWLVHRSRFPDEIGIPRTILINDFIATGHGLGRLGPSDLEVLHAGKAVEDGPVALLGAGTGLGEAYLTKEGGRIHVHPSEGGHSDFAPRNAMEDGLLAFLREKYGRVSYERILSGSGLVNCFEYIVKSGREKTSRKISEEMHSEDPAAVVSQHGLARDDPASTAALDLFISVYGAEAGNLALRFLAGGGVYVAGGIAPRIVERLKEGMFIRAFRDKPPHTDLLDQIPVFVITNPRVGLLGAASVALDLL